MSWCRNEDCNKTDRIRHDPTYAEILSERDRRPSRRGSNVVQEKVLEVYIEKGMQYGQKIVFQV